MASGMRPSILFPGLQQWEQKMQVVGSGTSFLGMKGGFLEEKTLTQP